MKIINKKQAHLLLPYDASKDWIKHSYKVAEAAEKIAKKLGLDSELAYSMGLLHDIGKQFTKGQFEHIVKGHEYMTALEYPKIARICLTHSFPIQELGCYVGEIDVNKTIAHKYERLLKSITYDDYDLLIQICDAVSLPDRYVLPEEKFVKSVFKYGFNTYTIEKWKQTLLIKETFTQRMNQDFFLVIK